MEQKIALARDIISYDTYPVQVDYRVSILEHMPGSCRRMKR